jgi:hypothetical protein
MGANVLRYECKFGVTKAYWLDFQKLIYIAFKLPNALYNKKSLSSSFLLSVGYECFIFHPINDTQNGGTLWPKFIHFY